MDSNSEARPPFEWILKDILYRLNDIPECAILDGLSGVNRHQITIVYTTMVHYLPRHLKWEDLFRNDKSAYPTQPMDKVYSGIQIGNTDFGLILSVQSPDYRTIGVDNFDFPYKSG